MNFEGEVDLFIEAVIFVIRHRRGMDEEERVQQILDKAARRCGAVRRARTRISALLRSVVARSCQIKLKFHDLDRENECNPKEESADYVKRNTIDVEVIKSNNI